MFKKVSDIIEIIQEFHGGLGIYFYTLKDEVSDERAILLLDFLGKGEDFLAEYLDKYKEATSKKILNSWVKYVPWLPTDVFCDCRKDLNLDKRPLEVYDILEIVWHFDECLIRFYTTLVQEIQNEEVGEIFRNLLRVTKKQEMNLSRDISWLYDL